MAAQKQYRTEFPDSPERARSYSTLEDAIHAARWFVEAGRRSAGPYASPDEFLYDAPTAIITNRGTGYRWILRRGDHRLEFQTPEMFQREVNQETIEIHLTVEEAEAVAAAAAAGALTDKGKRALTDQALDQIGMLCRQVRERVRAADNFIPAPARSIPRKTADRAIQVEVLEEEPAPPRQKYRPLGDADNLTLAEAGEILGKARNTLWLWYKKGALPPAVDVSPHLPYKDNPVIVVPRYRLEAWQAGQPMPAIFQDVFVGLGLHEPPWVCYRARKGAKRKDIAFWVERRQLTKAKAKGGARIYGEDLDQDKVYAPRGPL